MTGPWCGRFHRFGLLPAVLLLLLLGDGRAVAAGIPTVPPRLALTNPAADDQDDFCIWIHPSDAALSTVIASDKGAGRLFAYDLQGNLLQNVSFPGEPGNIDLRYSFPFGGDVVDIVCVNDRSANRLLVYRMDAVSRHLTRIDDNDLSIGTNYGLGLYRSPLDGAFHVFITTESGAIRQYELSGAGGQVACTLVRSWSFSSQTESCACDDETGFAYFGEEDVGIWKVGAEPGDATPGTRIAQVGDGSGLVADVEGLAIYYAAGGGGYLLASAQGNDSFVAYDRAPPHAPALHFEVAGVGATDGIDVVNVPLGPDFPYGIFAVHDDTTSPKAVQVCAYEDLGLAIDTGYWGPRGGPSVAAPQGAPCSAVPRIDSSPNPARGGTRIRYTLAEASTVELLVVDAAGRVVRRLLGPRQRAAGAHAESWDGRDDAGRAMPAGVYFCRLSTGRGGATAKMARIR